MNAVIRRGMWCSCVVGMLGVTAQAVDIRMVPIVADPGAVISGSDITIDPGDKLKLEIRVDNWGAETIRAVQGEMKPSSLTSGTAGSLALVDLDAANDGTCDFSAAFCPLCGPPFDLDGLFIDNCRKRCNNVSGSVCNPGNPTTCPGEGGIVACIIGYPDFFGQLPNINGLGVGSNNSMTLAFLWVGNNAVGAVYDNNPHYVASFVLRASMSAKGSFALAFFPEGDPMSSANGTFVRNQNSAPLIQPTTLTNMRVHIRAGRCCDGIVCTPNVTEVECATLGGTFQPGLDCSTGCPCTMNSNCNDGLFCTGVETCVAMACVPGTNPCTSPATPFCDEANDRCVFCFNNGQCDDGVFCNGPEQCVNGLCQAGTNRAMGTACGNPADTQCDNPDTCNGTGACVANLEPNGTACDDGAFCNVGETCMAGTCGGGGPRNCSDGLACTTDTCNEAGDACVNTLNAGFCLIAGTCYASGQANPGNECQACNPAMSTSSFSLKPNGTACSDEGNDCTDNLCTAGVCTHSNLSMGTLCNDGNPCTGTGQPGVGNDTCDGNGVCMGQVDPNCADDCVNAIEVFEGTTAGNSNVGLGPDMVEASCQPNSNNDFWFKHVSLCTGRLFVSTNGSVFAPSNDTVLSIHDSCGGSEIRCDDDAGNGLLSALTFDAVQGVTYFIRVAGYANNAGMITVNIRRVNTCLILGVCYDANESNPLSECQACTPNLTNVDWSNAKKGTPCGNGVPQGECDSADACNDSGACEENHKPDGTACTDDGNECTFDQCMTGLCAHPGRPMGTACGSPDDTECDNPDSCDGIDTCLPNYEAMGFACGDPTDTDCNNPDSCDGFGTCQINFEPDGTQCTEEGNDCTQNICGGGVCLHPNEPMGTLCGSPADDDCDNPDTCDGSGFCQSNFEPDGTTCDDNDICTDSEMCGTGVCIGVFIPLPPDVLGMGPKAVVATPLPSGTSPDVALYITSDDWPCVGAYVQSNGKLGPVAFFQSANAWGTIAITGVQIAPDSSYNVVAECNGVQTPISKGTTYPWADVNNDGFTNLDDVLCEQNAFNNMFNMCSPIEVNIAPCDPDAFVNLDDLLAVQNAFSGQPYPCPLPCPAPLAGGDGGADTLDPRETLQNGTVVLETASVVTPPGGRVEVKVFADGVDDLHDYQLVIDVLGGIKGGLNLVDVVIDQADPLYIFKDHASASLLDVPAGRVVNAVLEDGIRGTNGGYLATYVFEASADAAGVFRVFVRSGDYVLLRDSMTETVNVTQVLDAEVYVGSVPVVIAPAERSTPSGAGQ